MHAGDRLPPPASSFASRPRDRLLDNPRAGMEMDAGDRLPPRSSSVRNWPHVPLLDSPHTVRAPPAVHPGGAGPHTLAELSTVHQQLLQLESGQQQQLLRARDLTASIRVQNGAMVSKYQRLLQEARDLEFKLQLLQQLEPYLDLHRYDLTRIRDHLQMLEELDNRYEDTLEMMLKEAGKATTIRQQMNHLDCRIDNFKLFTSMMTKNLTENREEERQMEDEIASLNHSINQLYAARLN